MNYIIFGAQGYALGTYEAISILHPDRHISCFLVSELNNNASSLRGIPVLEVGDIAAKLSDQEKAFYEILIATPENVQQEVEEILERYGFYNHRRMTSERWDELMKCYHSKIGLFNPLGSLPVGNVKPNMRIFMAKFYKDKTLNTPPALQEFVIPIQVGAAKTDIRVAEVTDNVGENISERNGNYSELTGLYWLWKNELCRSYKQGDQEVQYYGYAQYRRLFKMSESDYLRLIENDVDVVLPYPLPYEPDINAHHERYLREADWQALLQALHEIHPEYADAFHEVLAQKYLFNYNVILAKKTVLCDYCDWLFPILARVEELSEPKGNERSDRYIGYMGETLETLYFLKNIDNLNLNVAVCKMYV